MTATISGELTLAEKVIFIIFCSNSMDDVMMDECHLVPNKKEYYIDLMLRDDILFKRCYASSGMVVSYFEPRTPYIITDETSLNTLHEYMGKHAE